MSKAMQLEGFVLTRSWRDEPEGLTLTMWLATGQGPVRARITGERAVMFVERGTEARCDERREVELTSLFGTPVDALYFREQRALVEERERLWNAGLGTYESDVRPSERFLMERFVTGGCRLSGTLRQRDGFAEMRDPTVRQCDYRPELRSASIDIETDGIGGAVVSIALSMAGREQVIMIGEGATEGARRLDG